MQLCPQVQASQDKSTGRCRHQGVSLPWLMGHTQGFFVQLDGGHGSSPRGVRFLDMSGTIRPAAIYNIYCTTVLSCSTLHQSPPQIKHSPHPSSTWGLQGLLLPPGTIFSFAPHRAQCNRSTRGCSTQHLNSISPLPK